MKKIFNLMLVAMVMLVAACENDAMDSVKGEGESLSFYAEIAGDTKAYIDDADGDKTWNTIWEEGDILEVSTNGTDVYDFEYDGEKFTCSEDGVNSLIGETVTIISKYEDRNSYAGKQGWGINGTQVENFSANSTITFEAFTSYFRYTYNGDSDITFTVKVEGENPPLVFQDGNLDFFDTITISGVKGENFIPFWTQNSNPVNATISYTINGVVCKEKATTLSLGKVYNLGTLEALVIKDIPYSETFETESEDFTIQDVTLGGTLNYVWSWDSYKYMKASAYVSSTNYESESWLLSPYFDLTSATKPVVMFDHAGNYFANVNTMKEEIGVYARENGGEWIKLTIPVYPSNSGWTFVNTDEISLAEFIGKNVQIGFKYTSTATKAGTWEIKNLYVGEAPFSMSADVTSVELENTASNGNIAITTKNSDGYTISAALKEANDWLEVSMTNNTVSYSAPANDGESRTAIIVVTATNGTDTQTLDVIVSQKGQESTATNSYEVSSFLKELSLNGTTTLTVGTSYNIGNIASMTVKKGTSTVPAVNKAGDLRLYYNSSMTLTSAYNIVKVEFTFTGTSYNKIASANPGTYNDGIWIGRAKEVTFTASSTSGDQARISKMVITYEVSGGSEEPATPVQLATPTVDASASGNTILVTWGEVANASSYTVTCGTSTQEGITGTSASFEGLDYNTTYNVTVVAVGDGTNYTNSEAGEASETTETAPSDGDGEGSTASFTLSGTFTSADSKLSLTQNGITVTQYIVSGTTAVNASYNTASTLRVYKGHALSFTGKTITKIEITYTGKYVGNTITVNTGSFTAATSTSGGTHVWTGESDNVVITNTSTAENVQLRPTAIKITYKN